MASVTYQEFKNKANEAVVILILVAIASLVKIFKFGYAGASPFILFASVLCIIFIIRLLIIAEKYMKSEKTSAIKGTTLDFVIVIILGCLSFYLFFVTGIYGIYLLFHKFSFMILVKKIIIIILSYRLVACTAKIQTVGLSKELNSNG